MFKSYDLLTEKIYQFERGCDDLRNKKRKLLMQEQKFHQLISAKFQDLERQQLGIAQSKQEEEAMTGKVEKKDRDFIMEIH